MRGIQQSLLLPLLSHLNPPVESKGVVYTKPWVVNLLLDLAGFVSSSNLAECVAIEPSTGDGAFLGPMIERLADSCVLYGREISSCRHSIVAFGLDQESAFKARALAVNILTRRGVPVDIAGDLAQSWVRTGDYLFDSMSAEADFVVGNPPYVRLEEIPEEAAKMYRHAYSTMRGRADLYIAFFEAALRQLKSGGTCAFICADRWMRNQYGADLRDLITSSFAVDIILEMHNAGAFHDEVDAYPAITVLRRHKQGPVTIASAGPEVESIPSFALSSAVLAKLSGKKDLPLKGLRTAHIDTWFKGSDPWPCDSPDQLALLRKLEETFSPLEANAKVGIGVATGNDKVFITKNAGLVEPSRLLKLAMAKDLTSGELKWSGHYLVDPWNCDGLVDLDQFPRLRDYFEQHATELKKRHTAIKSSHAWFKTIDRVTHSLIARPKLYVADIQNSLDPTLDRGETYPHHNLYFIQSDEWDLEVLGGLLISRIGQFFVESYGVRMRGGYLRFQAQYLRRIRVPAPSNLSAANCEVLRKALRDRDRIAATEEALRIYGVSIGELETALGH